MNHAKFSQERVLSLALILVGWTLYGFFFASQNYVRQAYEGRNPDFQRDLAVWLTCGYSWAILTYPILRLARRFPFDRNNWHRALSIHIPASFLFSISVLTIFTALRIVFGNSYSLARFQNLVVENIHSSILIYFGILGVRNLIRFLLEPLARVNRLSPQVSSNGTPANLKTGEREFVNEPSQIPDVGDEAPIVQHPASTFAERFSVKKAGRIVFINVNEIDLVTSEGNYVKIHSHGTTYLLRDTMKGMQEKLDPKVFARVRRSTIVRIEQIKELHPLTNGEYEVVMKNGTKLSSSRRYRRNLNGLLKA